MRHGLIRDPRVFTLSTPETRVFSRQVNLLFVFWLPSTIFSLGGPLPYETGVLLFPHQSSEVLWFSQSVSSIDCELGSETPFFLPWY